MKDLKNFKKFGAALTAVAMLGTLSTGVFAAEIDEIVEAPVIESVEIDVPIIPVDVEEVEDVDVVEDVDIPEDVVEEVELMTTGSGSVVNSAVDVSKTSDITITDVTATKATAGEETLYNVTLTYEMTYQTAAPQITLLGYLFTDAGNIPEAADVAESSIKAVDQKTHVEKSADNTKSIGEINFALSTAQDGVDDNAKLVLMVGTDADLTNENAQAVAISLASATSEGQPPVDEKWAAASATASQTTIDVPAGSDDAAIKTALGALTATVTDGGSNSASGVAITGWATSDTIADGATVTYTGTVTAGTDDAWTGSATVSVTVKIAEEGQGGGDQPGTVVKGDVNGNGRVQPNDGTMLMRYLAGKETLTDAQLLNADVNGNGRVQPNDGTMLMRVLAGKETLD